MTALWEHRRLVLSLVLCLVVALGAAVALHTYGPGSVLGTPLSASPTPSATPAFHEMYSYRLQTTPPIALRVGKPVSFRWVPTPEGRVPAASGPARVHCTVALYGPYPSLADLTRTMDASDGTMPSGTRVFTTPPLTTNDWDTMSHEEEVTLPQTLRPAYYEVDAECISERGSGTNGVGFPIQIGA
ncbi:MAG: hypothetical protein ACM3N4_03700 [Nitrososphaerota archaeon]